MLFSTCFSLYLSSQDSFTPNPEGVLLDWSSIEMWQPVRILPPTCNKLSHGPTKVSASWFYISFYFLLLSRAVLFRSVLTRYGPGFECRRRQQLFFLQKVRIRSGAHPPLIRRVSGSFSGRFCGRRVKLTTHLYLESRLKMYEAIPPHAFTAWAGTICCTLLWKYRKP